MHTEFWWGKLREINHFLASLNGRMILKRSLRNIWYFVDWIDLAHDTGKWQIFTGTI